MTARASAGPGPSSLAAAAAHERSRSVAPNPLLQLQGTLVGGVRQVTGVVASVPQAAARVAMQAWPTVEAPVRAVVGEVLPGLHIGYEPPATRSSYAGGIRTHLSTHPEDDPASPLPPISAWNRYAENDVSRQRPTPQAPEEERQAAAPGDEASPAAVGADPEDAHEAASKEPLSPRSSDRDQDSGIAPGLEALHEGATRVRGPSGRLYHERAFGRWQVYEFPRAQCIHIIEFPGFDTFVVLAIVCNVISMAAQSPLDPPGTAKALFFESLEHIFLAIFTTEMVLKMIACGVVGHPHSYLRDAWCQVRRPRAFACIP